MLTISPDSYIRLTLAQFAAIGLKHLISGMDEDKPVSTGDSAASTTISGYTEWVSDTTPPLSIGWDWTMALHKGEVRLARVGEPRSNCMLIDANGGDLGPARTSAALAGIVDALAWQAPARAHITSRYER